MGLAIFIDHHKATGAFQSISLAGDNVTVDAARQTREQSLVHVRIVIVEGDKATNAATKCDLIGVIVVPGNGRRRTHNTTKFDHISYFWPAMFAHPLIVALATGRIEMRRFGVAVFVGRRSYIASNTLFRLIGGN